MSNFFVSTDMTADMPPELFGEDFRILPMSYVLDGVEYDGKMRPFLTPHEFYTALENGGIASTSMVPVETAREYFAALLQEGKDVLHISFPAAMSGCFDGYLKAAKLAEADFPGRRIVVIDGKSACSGEGLLAWYAMQKRDGGATLDETAGYVYRGGRLSRGAALVGQAIKLNPILMVDENGALVHIGNVMGRKAAMRTLLAKMTRESAGFDNKVIVVAHGDCLGDAELLAEKVRERFPASRVIVTDVGPIIGAHCGKGMLAILYLAAGKTDRRL